MDKLKLAHDYAMKHLEGKFYTESEQWRVAQAWEYADMMLAEQEKRTDKSRPVVLDEFQVDWSQAPSEAEYWAMDSNGICYWYMIEPRLTETFPNEWVGGGYPIDIQAPSFNYQGDWKSSLQERK